MKERKGKEVDAASKESDVVVLENTNSADTSETTVATDFVISADVTTCDAGGSTEVVEDAMVIVATEASDDVSMEVSISTSEVEPDSTNAPELSFSFTTSTDEPEIDLSAELQVNAAFQLTSAETTEVEDEEEDEKEKNVQPDAKVTDGELQFSADITIAEVAEVISQEDSKHEDIESEQVETAAVKEKVEEVKERKGEHSEDESSVETVGAEPGSKEDDEIPQILEQGTETVVDGHESDDDAKVKLETKTEQETNLEESHLDNEAEACPQVEEAERLEADEEEARVKADEEAHLKFQEESRLDAEEEARLKSEEAEEEEKRLNAEGEERLDDEEESRLKSTEAEEEEKSLNAEEEDRVEAEEELRLNSDEAEETEEEKQIKAEEEQRLKADEARLKGEEEERLKAEDARLKVEEEERLKAEEARLKTEEAEEELRLKAEEEARLKIEEEARLKAEEEARKPKETEAEKAIKKTFIESRQAFQPIPDEFYSKLFYFSGMGTLIGSSLSAGIYVPEETIKCGLNAEQVESCVPETFDKHVGMVKTARTRANELSTELRNLQALLQALPIFTGEGAATGTQVRRSQSTSHASLASGTMTHRTRATSYAGHQSAHEGLSTPFSRAKDTHNSASTVPVEQPSSAEVPSVGSAQVPTVGAHYPFQKPGQRGWMPPSMPTTLMHDAIDNSTTEPSPRPAPPQPTQAARSEGSSNHVVSPSRLPPPSIQPTPTQPTQGARSERYINNVLSPTRLPPPQVHPKPRLVVTDATAPAASSTPMRRPWEINPDSLNVPGRRRARSVITPPAMPASPVSSPMGRDYGVFTAQSPSWQDKYGQAIVDDQPAPKPFAGGIPLTGLKTWQMSRLRALEARGFVVDSEQVYIDQTPARRASADVALSEIGSYAPYLVSSKSRVVDYAAQPMSPMSAKSFKPRIQNGFGGIAPLAYCDL